MINLILNNPISVVKADITANTDSELVPLMNVANEQGNVRVIIQLDVPSEGANEEGQLASQAQRIAIDSAQDVVVEQMSATNMETVATFETIPFMAVKVNASELEQLASLPEVLSVEEDLPIPTALDDSVTLIGADDAWQNGYSGQGQAVAILDTGIDLDHPAFTTGGNRIVAEGCYSTNDSGFGAISACPGGVESSTAVGSGVDCVAAAAGYSGAQSNCTHGTHVAGIAAGNDGTAVGVAKDADIIAIQIFSIFTTSDYCGTMAGCALTFTSDQIAGLERVYELRNSFNIASVNMSLGGSTPYSLACDSDSRKAIIDNLRAAGIATVIASGNNGYKDGISKPACISSAISVGSSDNNDGVSSFSNIAPILDLMAPGSSIYAAVPNDTYGTKSGTSMATPHVAGAWAIYKEAVPNASVDDVLEAFQATGTLIDDNRSGGIETNLPRINVDQAISSYVPGLSVSVEVSQSYVLPGESISYTIQVENKTAIAATNVEISNVIPDYLTLNPASLSNDAMITGVQTGDQIQWNTGETLAPNESLIRVFVATVDSSLTNGGFIENTAIATSPDMAEARLDTAVTIINTVSDCNLNDDFETASLASHWMAETTEDGRVSIISDLPQSGSYSLLLDDASAGGTYSEAGAILNIDLSSQSEIELSFDWFDLADEYDADYDGVFIRENPTSDWVKIYNFSGTNSNSYQSAEIDLIQAAITNGLLLSNQTQIKFGFYDNYPALFSNISGGDGYAIDNVTVSCVPAGLTLTQTANIMSLDPGQLITLTVAIANNDSINGTNAIISSDIPGGLAFAGPVTLMGTGGDVAMDGSDLPVIASGMSIPANGQITATILFTVENGISAGTPLSVIFNAKSDENPDWVSSSQTLVMANVAPVALTDWVTTTLNSSILFSPLDNDFDMNGDGLSITAVSQPTQGGIATTDSTAISYTPQNGFGGIDEFTYTVSDGFGGLATATVAVNVPNVPPIAVDDSTASQPNRPVYYPVTINDTDPNGDSLLITQVSTPNNGVASIENNQIVYTSTAGFEGTAVFTYTIADGNGGQDEGQISVNVGAGLNGHPVPQADEPSIGRDESTQLDLLNNDMDPNLDDIFIVSITQPNFGTAVLQGNSVQYTPMVGFVGVDSFEYTIRDAFGDEATTAVTVSVALDNTEIFDVNPNASGEQSFTTADGRITLSIPTGALESSVQQIAYTTLDTASARAMNQGVGLAFALNVGDGAQIFTGSPTFDPPLEIVIRYDSHSLPAGIDENYLQFFYFSESQNEWVSIDIIARDLLNNTVTARLSHFTDFSLGAGYQIYLPVVTND
ncbi:MAG: Ig-like domain-containing protein [Chloroflexota bacterium]